ncbi:MAG: YceI family protein [Rhodothermales bacterium]
MRAKNLNLNLFPVILLSATLMACGDVGDAPEAKLDDAMAIAGASGVAVAIDTSMSSIKWRAAKVTRAHDGGFGMFEGSVTRQGNELTGVDVTIDTRTIWSDTERLTSHLKTDDFFDVELYPVAQFVADRFAPVDSAGATHLVTGNLTMHGVTNGVTFPANIQVLDNTVTATADFIINRRDWEINYDGAADDLVEDQVRLILDITAPSTEPME